MCLPIARLLGQTGGTIVDFAVWFGTRRLVTRGNVSLSVVHDIENCTARPVSMLTRYLSVPPLAQCVHHHDFFLILFCGGVLCTSELECKASTLPHSVPATRETDAHA